MPRTTRPGQLEAVINFLPNDTLTGYARTAVDLRSRMVDYHRSPLAEQYLHALPVVSKQPATYARASASAWRTPTPLGLLPHCQVGLSAVAPVLLAVQRANGRSAMVSRWKTMLASSLRYYASARSAVSEGGAKT